MMKYQKNFDYYLSVCKELGVKNAMSMKQFDSCVDNNDTPYLKILRDHDYNFKQTKADEKE